MVGRDLPTEALLEEYVRRLDERARAWREDTERHRKACRSHPDKRRFWRKKRVS